MRKLSILMSLLVACALLLAACAPAEEGEPGLEDTPGVEVTPVLEETPIVEATAEITVEPTPVITEAPTLAVTEAVEETETAEETGTPEAALETNPNLASELLGLGVWNEQGENLGEIDELVLDRQSGQIHYAVLGAGGFLGIGERKILIPWGAFNINVDAETEEQLVTLNVDEEVLVDAPNFEDVPDVTAADWDADIRAFWQEHVEILPVTGAAGEATTLFRLSDPTDVNIQNTAGEDIGDIEDMTLDLNNGQISYVILATGGALDLGECLLPVPWQALTISDEDVAGVSEAAGTPGADVTPAAGGTPEAEGTPTAPASGEGLTEDDDLVFVLDTDAVDLTNAPCFEGWEQFPDTRVSDWDNEIREFWANITG